MKLALAQFRELAAFSQFSTDLDADTKQTIERGQRLTELLKQPQFAPYSVWEMYSMLFVANNGGFDSVPLEKIEAARESLHRTLKSKHAKLTDAINTGDKPSDEQNEQLMKVAKEVAEQYKPAKEAK